MPSSISATALATVTAWEPQQFHRAPPPTSQVTLPAFTVAAPDAPTVRAFEISRTIGIPDDLLASETAAARASGYAEGWATGMAEARQATNARRAADRVAADQATTERNAQQQRAFHALFDAAADFESRAVPAASDIEEQIVSTAWTIAAALVGQTIADENLRSTAAVRRALSLAPSDGDVTVTVSQEDFAVLTAENPEAAAAQELCERREGRMVRIVPRDSMTAGDAYAHCGATTIDARLTAAMDRVRQVLDQ